MNDRRLPIWIGAGLICLVLIAATVMAIAHTADPKVLGRWRLHGPATCSGKYPSEIEFFPDKQYVTSGLLPSWSGGQYELVDGTRIRLETRNGIDVYPVELHENSLIFTNASGCAIMYDRVGTE